MVRSLSNYFGGIPPVFIDGLLYSLIAWLIFSQSYLGGDEASKYISPALKFWINYVVGGLGALLGAVKMFRSTSFAEHQDNKTPPSYTPPDGKDTPTP
jgi:hypothetical protein